MSNPPDPTEAEIFANADPFGSGPSPFDGPSMATGADSPAATPTPGFAPLEIRASCLEVHRSLEIFMDGELSAPQHRAVTAHLTVCPPCQRVHAFQVQLRNVVATKAIDPMPDDVRARITRALGFD